MVQQVVTLLIALATTYISYQAILESAQDSRISHQETYQQNAQDTESGLAEHYSAAVAQLDSHSILERLGGIHSLERIAIASATMSPDVSRRYRSVVLDLLCAFVRQEAPDVHQLRTPLGQGTETSSTRPRVDVAAALTAIEKRPQRLPADSVDLSRRDLTGADLDFAHFEGADFSGSRLAYGTFSKASFSEANLDSADLTGARLNSANLSGAKMVRSVLTGSDLIGSDLSEARLGLADLSRAKLGGAKLMNARLTHAKLFRADLGGANLSRVTAVRADLRRTDLNGARLSGAQLNGASFDGANLNQSDLTGADLSDAKGLTLQQLRSAKKIDADTRLPNGFSWSAEGGVRETRPSPEKR
ncbi:pentapeptide repeat-containing protein [Streptomyces sp. MBT62]|uniref:pentapeptide repeat-containing protein n=1 Tax=Streptomyces sp. MBT62 TaxID=2800410 RepID=UPI001909865B|nr:pentapeptide repeat-containing protein [Streptomyces sp. MBT62]MBK3568984.1 pentapeptide repeat-containing protein [Streptomyces sp. MBT62]